MGDLYKTRNPGSAEPEYMELQNLGSQTSRVGLLRGKYPALDENLVEITVDEKGKQQISFLSARTGSWTKPIRLYNEDGSVRKDADKKIRSGKYNNISTQLDDLDASDQRLSEDVRTLKETRDRSGVNEREQFDQQIEQAESQMDENEQIRENLEERMPLKDRIKRVFKKYGFTVASVLTAVGITIGVIVSQLKSGLTSVAKGVGNGLKTIGKKLGEILPGMVGAIASFIFKTAGEVVGFLAKNAWLLIVAAVVYFIEKVKK